jgi:putative transposase
MAGRNANGKLAKEESQSLSPLTRKKLEIINPLRGLRPIPAEKLIEAQRAAGELLGKEEGEVSHQTIRNWVEIVETEGPKGLERKQHKNRGVSKLPPQLVRVIRGILLHPRRFTPSEATKRAQRYARDYLKLKDKELPTYKQVKHINDQITPEERTLAHEGRDAWRKKYEQYTRFEAPSANAIWQGDHHQLDYIVIDEVTGKELGRPWLTKIQDDKSRAICGYHLSLDHPSRFGISLALRHAILPKKESWGVAYGLPGILYVDNGKDWVSNHIQDVCLTFGIELIAHEPYHPQSKGKVERYFRTLEEACIHPLDGSVGSNVQKRPKKRMSKLTLAQLRAHIDKFIDEYHERIHGTTKQKPKERWLADKNLVRTVTDICQLDHLLLQQPRKVYGDGVQLQYARYLDHDGVLGRYIDQTVTIFYDPRDIEWVRVWARETTDTDSQYVCTAYRQNSEEHKVSRDKLAEHNRLRYEMLREQIREDQREGNRALGQVEKREQAKLAEYLQVHEEDADENESPGEAQTETSREETNEQDDYEALRIAYLRSRGE